MVHGQLLGHFGHHWARHRRIFLDSFTFCFLLNKLTYLSKALMTIIVLIWEIAAESCAPRAYNYWAVLAMEIFLFLNWIDSLAWFVLESCLLEPSAWEDVCSDYYNYSTQTYETTCTSESNSSNTLRTMIYLGAGLTGVLL